LTAAGAVAKLMGALYRIPLYSILGSEGMGLYQMAYPIYSILLTVSSAGLNVAISKAVAERWALGRREDARSAFRVSLVLMVLLGLAASVSLYGLSGWIAAHLAKDPRAAVSIAAISPALFMASVLSALRGWFQGIEEMTVPAVSQVLEQAGRLATLALLGRALMPRGVAYAAGGATSGAVVGAGLGVAYAAVAYWTQPGRKRLREAPGGRDRRMSPEPGERSASLERREPWPALARAIVAVAVPISLASAVFGITELVDLSLVPGRLQAGGLPPEEATRLYGQLTGGALPLVNLATVFTASLQMALVPSITAAVAQRDRATVKRRVDKALCLTYALGLPAALGLYVLADPIPRLLFHDPAVGTVLRPVAPAVLFLALQQVTAGVLQGVGKITTPLVNLMWAVAVKAVLTFTLVSLPGVGIRGAAIATSFYFGVAALLNLWAVRRELGRLADAGPILKLSLAGSVMAVVASSVYRAGAGPLGPDYATVAAIGAGALSYGTLAAVLKAVDLDDLATVPVLGGIFRRFHRDGR